MSACTAGTSCSVVLRKTCRCWHGGETIRQGRARSTSREEGFCAMETRTIQHLDPHSQAPLLTSTRYTRRRRTISHPRGIYRKASLRESVAIDPCAVHVKPRTCFHTAVRATWMSSRTTRDKKTQRTALISERRVDDPTTSRHRATTPETKNDKRTQGICTMGATTVREMSTVVAAT